VKIIRCEQVTQEWFDLHLGRCTASHAKAILRDDLAPYSDYLAKKVAEILTGQIAPDRPPNFEMQWGIDHEAEARRAYSLSEGVFVEQVGFVIADDERFGCSPDGLVGDKGMVQFKCPKSSTHLTWMLMGILPAEHLPQCRFELAVNGDRQWNQFVSFDPRLPKRYQLFKAPLLMREDAEVPKMLAAADAFMQNVEAVIAKLKERCPELPEEPPEDIGELGIGPEELAILDRAMQQ